MNKAVFLLPLLIFLMISPISAQKAKKPMTGSAAKGAASGGMQVAPDLTQRLAKYRRVEMPFHSAGLTEREKKLAAKLVDAARNLEDIYWRQIDPEALTLYQSLANSKNPKDQELRHYLWINGSRFDLIEENRPFVGIAPMPPGKGFYPEGLTRERIEKYVLAHPDKKAEIYSSTTVVRWNGDRLEGLPYHLAYRSFLEPAARDLREAASLSDDPAFANFLRLRADALLTDDYFKSDLAWLDLKDPKFDVIFAPYETYDDDLLGVKGSFGGAVLVRNEAESQKLAMFQKYVADVQDALPLAPEDRPSKHGLETPMEVMDAPYRVGDLRHGYQAVADNLPNDPRVHEQKGSKKIFFKNFMDARVNYVVLPLAQYMMPPDQAAKASAEAYLLFTIMHEMAHGLGPAYARTATGKASIRESIGPAYSGLEEAKADVVGMFGLKWLVDHNALPQDRLEEYYASYVAGIFRTVRFGVAEAHGQAQMMEFNYLLERGAIKRQSSGVYAIDYAAMPGALSDLAKELLDIEATGSRERAESWFKKYDVMSSELLVSLKAASKVPVDVDPVFSFPETVR
ncbi:MAG: Zn-dependent hydrolase [Terriglobales bacterium]